MKTLITGGTLVTCNADDEVYVGDVLLEGREIVAIGKKITPREVVRRVRADGCAVMPGFVQAHVHLCQVLMRGMADDMPLLDWLRSRIWPLEAAHDDRTLKASADLGLAEMMLAGTTSILDMGTVHGHDVVMDAMARAGIRGIGGKAMMDVGDGVPKRLRETTRASLAESDRLCDRWSGRENGRLGYAYAPRFVLSCTEALVRGVAERARHSGALMHTHVAEHAEEREAVRRMLGHDDVAILRQWGLYGEQAVWAHGVQLTDEEARRIAKDGTHIVHCPSANLKLGSGIARVADLDRLGVSLALGADGAPCNNNLDPWIEMRHAALLAKARTGTTTLTAKRALRLATIDGARALGLASVTGSLEVGKRADVIVVDLEAIHALPGGDAPSRLVYACTARDVRHVFVDGVPRVSHRELAGIDLEELRRRAKSEAMRLTKAAGID